jgi:hypothetical protein
LKQALYFFSLLLYCFSSYAQAPEWDWARSPKSSGSGGANYGGAICFDEKGDIYVVGQFSNPLISFGDITLTNTGSQNIFIVKYSSIGNVIWAKSIQGKGFMDAEAISSDPSGNIYITGSFYSPSIIFDSISIFPVGKNWPVSDIFIAKFDSSGKAKWAKGAGGFYDDEGTGIIADKTGNIYAIGTFESKKVIFDNDTLWNSEKNGTTDIYICKYDSLGNLKWARKLGGDDFDIPQGISEDANRNLYLTAYCPGALTVFGNDTLGNSDGSTLILKFDSLANVIWAKREIIPSDLLAVQGFYGDEAGNLYLTGYFSDTCSFGKDTLISRGSADVFIVKYDSACNEQWAKSAGGTSYDNCGAVIADSLGDVYIAGNFTSPLIYFGNDSVTNDGQSEMVITKYDQSGNLLWTKSASASSYDYSNHIKIDPSGNLVITGDFLSRIIVFGNDTLSYAGTYYQIFTAKLGSNLSEIIPIENQNSFSVFPNPSYNQVTINLPNGVIRKIQISNVLGQIVFEKNLSNNYLSQAIELSQFPKGLYLMTAFTSAGEYESKFIKQ